MCGKWISRDGLERVAPADRDRGRRPLADAVHGQHRGLLERRGKEGGGGVALVVLGEEQLRLDAFAARPRAASAPSPGRFWKSFSLSQTGIAMRNERKPRGA